MPSGVIARELNRAGGGVWPGVFRRLWVHVNASKLDRALAGGADPSESVELSLRAGQLVDADERERIARRIDAVVHLVANGKPAYVGFSRIPVNRAQVDANQTDLERLAEILRRPGPLSPRGVAMARQLMHDFRGPIYTGGPSTRLSEALARTLTAFEN